MPRKKNTAHSLNDNLANRLFDLLLTQEIQQKVIEVRERLGIDLKDSTQEQLKLQSDLVFANAKTFNLANKTTPTYKPEVEEFSILIASLLNTESTALLESLNLYIAGDPLFFDTSRYTLQAIKIAPNEEDNAFPVNLKISKYTSKTEMLEYIEKNWQIVRYYQGKHLEEPRALKSRPNAKLEVFLHFMSEKGFSTPSILEELEKRSDIPHHKYFSTVTDINKKLNQMKKRYGKLKPRT